MGGNMDVQECVAEEIKYNLFIKQRRIPYFYTCRINFAGGKFQYFIDRNNGFNTGNNTVFHRLYIFRYVDDKVSVHPDEI